MPPISPSDLFLSPDLVEEDVERYLKELGFRHPKDTCRHARLLADDPSLRQMLDTLAAFLLSALRETPDPDRALVGLSRCLPARKEKIAPAQLSALRIWWSAEHWALWPANDWQPTASGDCRADSP